MNVSVGIVLFPNVTQLDVTGPYEVFARMPATRVHVVAASLEPIRGERGLTLLPDLTFDAVPPLDVICVPGGIGVNAAMEDEGLLSFLRHQATGARYVTSVCTGALVLGAAGLLQGYRATTHWLSLELLSLFGAHPVDSRVVVDRNRITGGGVTAGIDLGLVMASELCGVALAREIQLMIEHAPVSLHTTRLTGSEDAAVARRVVRTRQRVQADRRAIAERAAARLECGPAPAAEGVDITSLEPGTTLIVHTRNSQYRVVILFDSSLVLVQGGARFPEATLVRLAGATAGGRRLKTGWILVGFHMEMWLDSRPLRSSRVCSISIEGVPPLPAQATH